MKPRYLVALALATLLAGCAPDPWTPAAFHGDMHARDAALAARAKAINGTAPATLEELEIHNARAAQFNAQQAANNHAMAECNYVAKQASSAPHYTGYGAGYVGAAITNSFAGLIDGTNAGQNCVDYYRNIGVIR